MGPAELLAREAIQNSADAARDYRKEGIPFKVRFRFETFTGADKLAFTKAFGLLELRERLSEVSWPEGLPPIDASTIDDNIAQGPLQVLYIEDYGAHGLRGPKRWMSDSDLFNAIYMVGTSNKRPDAGGSFGFGKSAVFNAGTHRAIYAYSCFEPGFSARSGRIDQPKDPVSRRAVGFLYWKAHNIVTNFYDGRAEYADSLTHAPFEDEAADRAALSWGINLRDHRNKGDHGTTFAVVAPRITPEELQKAIEYYWWPAIIDQAIALDVQITSADGRILTPNLSLRKDLKVYIEAYSIAQNGVPVTDASNVAVQSSEELDHAQAQGPWRPETGSRPSGVLAGNLGVILPAEDQVSSDDYGPVIARIRSTRMVIDYLRLDGRARIPLPLRSVYIASQSEDPLLRKTEDAGHAGWAERGDPPLAPYELAASISQGVKEALRDICALAMPRTQERELRATAIGRLLALPGRGGTPDDAHESPRILVKQLVGERANSSEASIYAINGSFTVQAAAAQAKQPNTRIRIELNVKYSSESDDPETLPYILSAPRVANAVPRLDGAIEITLRRGDQATIEYTVPGLRSNRPYGVTIEPVVTVFE
jgi:hypothetical protein